MVICSIWLVVVSIISIIRPEWLKVWELYILDEVFFFYFFKVAHLISHVIVYYINILPDIPLDFPSLSFKLKFINFIIYSLPDFWDIFKFVIKITLLVADLSNVIIFFSLRRLCLFIIRWFSSSFQFYRKLCFLINPFYNLILQNPNLLFKWILTLNSRTRSNLLFRSPRIIRHKLMLEAIFWMYNASYVYIFRHSTLKNIKSSILMIDWLLFRTNYFNRIEWKVNDFSYVFNNNKLALFRFLVYLGSKNRFDEIKTNYNTENQILNITVPDEFYVLFPLTPNYIKIIEKDYNWGTM